MAMTEQQIREALHRSFSNYGTKMRRAGMVLSNSMAVLTKEADLAKLPEGRFAEIAREEMDSADERMRVAVDFIPPLPSTLEQAS